MFLNSRTSVLSIGRRLLLITIFVLFGHFLEAQEIVFQSLNPARNTTFSSKNAVQLNLNQLSNIDDGSLEYSIDGSSSENNPIRIKIYTFDETSKDGIGSLIYEIYSNSNTSLLDNASYETYSDENIEWVQYIQNNGGTGTYLNTWNSYDIKTAALAIYEHENRVPSDGSYGSLPIIIEVTNEGHELNIFHIPGIGDINFEEFKNHENLKSELLLSDSPKFAMIGDYGWEGPNAESVANLVKSWNVDYVVTMGDDNYQDKLNNSIDANIGQYYHEYIYPYNGQYGEGSIDEQNHFFPTLGNHDYKIIEGFPEDYLLNAWLSYFELPMDGNEERYYSHIEGDVRFFHMNWNPKEPDGRTNSSVQGEWLREELASSTSRFNIVVGHQTPYSSGFTDRPGHGNSSDLQWPFKEWGADLVVSGHEHIYERLRVDNMTYLVNGVGGAPLYNFIVLNPNHISHIEGENGAVIGEVKEDRITFRFVSTQLKIQDEFDIFNSPYNNLQVKGYERHTELSWSLDAQHNSDLITTEIFRSSNGETYEKIGQTTEEYYIDFVGEEGINVGNGESREWYYKLKAHHSEIIVGETDQYTDFSEPVSTNTRPMDDVEFLEMVQKYTFRYFWDFAHPVSGMIYEDNTSVDANIIAIGGTGIGVMTIPVGIERGYITRQEGRDRVLKILNFITSTSNINRYHGAWPHWIHGETGVTIPFSERGDGADLVETAILVQGLLTLKEYFDDPSNEQESQIRTITQQLWEGVEWDWFVEQNPTDSSPKAPFLNWHWSPTYGFEGDVDSDGEAFALGIHGWNEGLIAYILAISSPTHPASPLIYNSGWARNGDFVDGATYDGIQLPLGQGGRGGPLFVSQYSFLGMDPRKVGDIYTETYFDQGRAQSLINRAYCIDNPKQYLGYSENCWGLTASSGPDGYHPHEPSNTGDLGTIAPTAAISAMPYTPEESIEALKYLYRQYGHNLWGFMGFYDAFNPSRDWTSSEHIAINQGPMVLMIENYRSQLLWDTFMKNSDLKSGLQSINEIRFTPTDDLTVNEDTIKIFINGEEVFREDVSKGSHFYPSSEKLIEAVVGDEMVIEVYDTSVIPEISGLADVWVAMAFINEGIFMSSKSITPGAYKPWVPFSTVSHSTLALPYNRNWLTGKYQSNTYPEWKKIGNKYRLRWTLQRTMDPNMTNSDGLLMSASDTYPDEAVPWWQTWDEEGRPIVDGTGKFNKDGSVPFGNRPKPNGQYPQRQGKNMGLDMLTLHGLKGTIKTAYGGNTNFSDGSHFYVKSDADDTYTTEFKELGTTPFNVVTPTAELYRPFTELWKVIPDEEMNNPVSEIVTWYQKEMHVSQNKPLSENYTYDGYEIWEEQGNNPSSKAPGLLDIVFNQRHLNLRLRVESPLQDDQFYTLYKSNDNDAIRDKIITTNDLEIGFDKPVKSHLIADMRANGSKFDLVLGYSTWNPDYSVHPLELNDDGTFSNTTFKLNELGPGPALHAFLSYRRTPISKPVIISGIDFWQSNQIEALRCEEYRNQSEGRSLRKSDFSIYDLRDEPINISKHLGLGYALSKVNEEYTIMEGEQLTFKIWDNVDFGFQQTDTKWYMSSRKRSQQLSEADGAKRVKITLYKVANNGALISEEVLQDFNTGSSLTHSHTYHTSGNYIYEVSLDRDGSAYQVFVRVLNSSSYNEGEEGRIKVRNLLPREVEYINSVLSENESINGSEYKLAMVTDVQASYSWKKPEDGGGPRSYSSNGETRYIDRFAPFNDYADHYVYRIDASETKWAAQNVSAIQSYVSIKDSPLTLLPEFRLLPGIWVNHLDPLGESANKYGVQDEFNLGSRILDINSSFVEDAFNQVQQTNARLYEIENQGRLINSRSPKPWEIRLPWASLSKYHGFRLRTAPKSPVNARVLKEIILNIGREGGGDYFPLPPGLSSSGSGGTYGGTSTLNDLVAHKSGFLDTDEQKLEYAFFLNLKHNRWVVIPREVENITFYHGDDQNNQIASGFTKDDASLSGLSLAMIEAGKYAIVNSDDLCVRRDICLAEGVDWADPSTEDAESEFSICGLVDINYLTEDVDDYTRTLSICTGTGYLGVDVNNNLAFFPSESTVVPYELIDEMDRDFLSVVFKDANSETYTKTSYRLVPIGDLTISNNRIESGLVRGTHIGELSISSENSLFSTSAPYSFSLSGTDASLFEIWNDRFLVNKIPLEQGSYEIEIKASRPIDLGIEINQTLYIEVVAPSLTTSDDSTPLTKSVSNSAVTARVFGVGSGVLAGAGVVTATVLAKFGNWGSSISNFFSGADRSAAEEYELKDLISKKCD